MCIIGFKTKGTDFIPIKYVHACVENNPDGFAVAWNAAGVLNVFKTMDKSEFLARYMTLIKTLNSDETAMVIHARIATHGSKRIENCHLWTNERGDVAFAHNGILHGVRPEKDMTDSETFFRRIFLPAYEKVGNIYAGEVSSVVIESDHYPSKFVWIDKDGNIGTAGNFQKIESEGIKGKLYFSNMGYLPRNTYYSSSSLTENYTSSNKERTSKKRYNKKSSSSTSTGSGLPTVENRCGINKNSKEYNEYLMQRLKKQMGDIDYNDSDDSFELSLFNDQYSEQSTLQSSRFGISSAQDTPAPKDEGASWSSSGRLDGNH